MAEVHIQLFGGEQDGYRTNVDLRGEVPELFFIWRASDNEVISMASGRKRMLLADKLAVLAYKLTDQVHKPGVANETELRYLRHAAADKKLTDPAL